MQYDIDSIMHYDSFIADHSKKPSILTKNNEKIKVNTKMSPIDIAKLNQLYPFNKNPVAENTCAILKNKNTQLKKTNGQLSSNNKKCQALLESYKHASEQKTPQVGLGGFSN